MMNVKKTLCLSLLFVLFLGALILPPRLTQAAPPAPLTPTVGYAERMDVSPALRDMVPLPATTTAAPDVNLRLPKAAQSILIERA
ncbi:MAG: hypothetical protein JW910_15465, partial [Anaerolineae bacterium]|nr:hypothetical protein [Anaerolineae bacterium]